MQQQALAELVEHCEVAPRHFRMRLRASAVARTAQAGQFVHILPRNSVELDPLLRRAFSILVTNHDTLDVLYRIEGRGTAIMAQWRVGEMVDILGPLGVPFAPLPRRALLVGGGVGVPPLVMLAAQRFQYADKPYELTGLIGARSRAELICLEDFERYQIPVRISTDDGSTGHHGRVTDLLEEQLEQLDDKDEPPTVFACGPLAMLRAVSAICSRFVAPCQISLEENMPCGVGVCNGCVVPVNVDGNEYSRYRRICIEGPVLWAHEVDWSQYLTMTSCP